MTLPLRLAADAVALLHLGFVRFVAFGGLWVGRWPRLDGSVPPWVRLWGGRVARDFNATERAPAILILALSPTIRWGFLFHSPNGLMKIGQNENC